MKCSSCGAKGHNLRTCARNNPTSAKKIEPRDPGTYERNNNPTPQASVSSSTQQRSSQETNEQFQNRTTMDGANCRKISRLGINEK
ncbi:hypothetical protein CsatB_007683 [Cannabis sativa]